MNKILRLSILIQTINYNVRKVLNNNSSNPQNKKKLNNQTYSKSINNNQNRKSNKKLRCFIKT